MSIVNKLSIATVGAAFIALGVGTTAPATAASLDFSFTTASGGTGSFTLDTDTAPGSEPAFFFVQGQPLQEGFGYAGAVSDFSFSSQATSLSNLTGDINVYPTVNTSEFSADDGVLSLLFGPSGRSADENPLVEIALVYLGNVSELPVLSDEPSSYSSLFGIQVYGNDTVIVDELITEYQVVPEPGSVLGTLALGIGGAGLLLKRQMNRKKAAIRS